MSFIVDYVQYTPWYDTFVGVSGTDSSPSNWHVIIPSTVTNSGTVYTVKTLFSIAFVGRSNLISIVLPDTITSFGNSPFYYCTSLTSIVLGANTVSISSQFAENCFSLRNINILDTIQVIANNAFANTGLTSIVLPNNPNLQIRDKAFAGSAITNVTFPNYNVYLNGWWIFSGCVFLTSINFGNAIQNIPYATFQNCTSLINVVIPNSVINIESACFVNCTSLTSVILPNNLPYLPIEMFNTCISLTNIVIPSSVTLIEGYVFNNCFDLTNITIPSSIKRIGNGSFQNCTSLTNFVIPDSVTIIGNAIFNGCNSLTNITISTGITSLPGNFFNTPFIRSFVVPENIKIISDSCFGGGYIENLYIPDSVTSIGIFIFMWSSVQLTSIRLPSNLHKIPDSFFERFGGFSDNLANNIQSIIPASVTEIGSGAFQGTNVKRIDIPYGVIRLGNNTFNQCGQLTHITFPNTLKIIGNICFTYAGFRNVIIPSSVTTIGSSAFGLNSGLTKITINAQITEIPFGMFSECQSLTKVNIPNIVNIIRQYAFYTTPQLINIFIPSSVTSIESQSFRFSGVKKAVFLGSTIPTISSDNFTESTDTAFVQPNTSQTELNKLTPFFSNITTLSLDPPQNVTGIAGNNSATISWTSSVPLIGEITKYQISYYDITTPSTVATLDVSGNVNQTTITGLTNNQTYGFSIKAFIDDTELSTDSSSTVQVTPKEVSIDAPQNVTGTTGINIATISWSAVTIVSPYTITKYQISYYDISNSSIITNVDISANVTQSTILELTANVTYEFSVKAFSNLFASPASSSVQVTPFSLNAPQNVSGTAGVSSATISWSAVTVPVTITKYQINYFLSVDQSSVFNNIVVNTTTPWGTGNNIRNIAFALTADEKRAIRTSFNNSLIYLSSYNSSWSEFIQITDNVYRNYSGLALNADGSRGVACCGITSNGYIYYFTWTGTTYSTLTQILDTTDRNYMGISLSDDGSVLVVSSNTGIYFATWNGSNYSVLTKTLESRNISFIGANVSRDGLRIVYGANEIDNYVYWADWNGTNFNNGTLIDTIFISRCLYFASDKNIIWLTSANYSNDIPFLYYSTWNGTTYNPFTSLPLSSIGYIDGWGLWVNSNGNNVYLASFNTGSYYKFNFPSHITTFTPLDVSGNITQKVITGLTNNQNYSFSVKAFINDASSVASSTVQVTPFSLNAPQNVSGTIGINSATISWSAVTVPSPNTITKYQISYYDITSPSNISTLDVSGNITQSKISGLTGNVTYEFSIKAFVNNLFLSDDSSKVQITPFSLNAPQNVNGTIGISSATISWSAVTAHLTITKYQIIYYDISNSSNISTLDVSANLTQLIITSLTNDVTYEFSVKAFINEDSSVASSSVQVTPLAINTPQNFTGVSSVNMAIINWSAVTVRSPYTITKYQIRYYDISNSSIINTVDISGNIIQTTISELTGNVTYEFSIKAFVNNLSSVDSSKIQITPFSLNPPQNVTGIENINNGATISWLAVILPSPNVITKYQLSYYNITTQSNIITLDLSGNVNQIILTNLTNNETYEFSVKSFMNNFSSIDSSTNQVTPFVVGIPQNVLAVPALNSATISWSTVIIPSPYIITKYQVSYYNTITPEVISIGETNTTSLTINGIEVNKIYNFSVKAFFYSNSSELSSIVSIELSVNNILNEGLKNINNEPPPPTFLYDLVTSSSFTTEELATAGITVVPIIVSKEEQQQQVQTLIEDFTSLGLEITYVNYNIG